MCTHLTSTYKVRTRRPPLLEIPRTRIQLMAREPFTRALATLHGVADTIDLFHGNKSEFTRVALHIIRELFCLWPSLTDYVFYYY